MILLEDQRELETLHNRFIHATDRRDYAQLRALYTEDGIENHGGYNGPVDEFIPWLQNVHENFECITHVLTNLQFSVEGDTAESEGRGTAYIRMKGEHPYNIIVINRHFDQYRKVGGKWLFSCRSLCVDWIQPFPAIEEGLDLIQGIPVGTMDLSDPVYKNVPKFIASLRSGLPPLE